MLVSAIPIKKKVVKKSQFRERQHEIDEKKKRRNKKSDTEDEMAALAERRFLDQLLDSPPVLIPPPLPPTTNFDDSEEVFGDMSPEEVKLLIELLRRKVSGRYMEGEGEVGDIDDEEKRKKMKKKRLMWQDAFRSSLGDENNHGNRKRQDNVGEWEEVPREMAKNDEDPRWWTEIDPRLIAALAQTQGRGNFRGNENGRGSARGRGSFADFHGGSEEVNEGENFADFPIEFKRQQHSDMSAAAIPWLPPIHFKRFNDDVMEDDVTDEDGWKELKRVPLKKRKRTSFRERTVPHGQSVTEFVGMSKRALPIKRSLPEPVKKDGKDGGNEDANDFNNEDDEVKKERICGDVLCKTLMPLFVKKSVDQDQPKMMEELNNIMADEKDEDESKKETVKRKREDSISEEETTKGDHEVKALPSLKSDEVIEDAPLLPQALPLIDEDDDVFSDEDFSEETINDYFGKEGLGERLGEGLSEGLSDNRHRKREAGQKRKRSWDEYFGFDKRMSRKRPGVDENDITMSAEIKKKDGAAHVAPAPTTTAAAASAATTAATKPPVTTGLSTNVSTDNVTTPHDDTTTEKATTEVATTTTPEDHTNKLSDWMMNRYFKSMASAMSSKRKRTVPATGPEPDEEEDQRNERGDDHPLAAMDRRLEAIENLMLEEALELVEGAGAGDGEDADENREKIIHRLDAAHSLEKMREALAEFEGSLGEIRSDVRPFDEEEDEQEKWEEVERKRRKKFVVPVKKQNLVEAFHAMAPQATKRTSEASSDEDFGGMCPVFTEIVAMCEELSKLGGDSQRALVGACNRHVMCYACDYAYDETPRIPCDLVFMREAHDICGDNIYCQSSAAQIHGALRQKAAAIERSSVPVCLSQACVRAYRRR